MLREALAIIDAGIASQEAVDATMKYALGPVYQLPVRLKART